MGWVRRAFLVAAPCLGGCNAAFWGNLGVLGVTVAIFLGTVFLSRSRGTTRSALRSAASSRGPAQLGPGAGGATRSASTGPGRS